MSFTNPKPSGYAFGERLPSADVNTVWGNVADAVDKRVGGLEIDARTGLQRVALVPGIPAESTLWDIGEFAHVNSTLGGTVANVVFPLTLPNGATVTAIRWWYKGGNGHAGLPSVMPQMILRECVLSSDTRTSIATKIDDSADVSAFQARHAVDMTGLSYTIDNTTKRVVALFQGEFGTNALEDGTVWSSILVTFDVSALDEG